MWECCCFKPKGNRNTNTNTTATATATATATTKPPPPPEPPSRNEDHHHQPAAAIGHSTLARTPIMLAAASWLRTRRSRYLILLVCSPLILPFLCVTFPILCAVELCLRLFCRSWKSSPQEDEERLRRCEEGLGDKGVQFEAAEEVGLLQRYLEDQMLLVGSVYECVDEEDDDDDYNKVIDARTPLLG